MPPDTSGSCSPVTVSGTNVTVPLPSLPVWRMLLRIWPSRRPSSVFSVLTSTTKAWNRTDSPSITTPPVTALVVPTAVFSLPSRFSPMRKRASLAAGSRVKARGAAWAMAAVSATSSVRVMFPSLVMPRKIAGPC